MGIEDLEHVEITSRAAWRAWLEANHTRSEGIWLVYYKKHCGERSVAWEEIVQEALCFGWIDSRAGSVDADRTKIVVTPRRPRSRWSAVNKQHLQVIAARGGMTPAGQRVIDAAIADGSWTWLDEIEALVLPADLESALAAADQRERWEALGKGQRKVLLASIKEAKRPPTRAARIEAAVQAARDLRG